MKGSTVEVGGSWYFQFSGQFYQQVHHAPMVSPASVVISEMFMEYMEEEATDTALPDTIPKIWH